MGEFMDLMVGDLRPCVIGGERRYRAIADYKTTHIQRLVAGQTLTVKRG